MKYEHKLLVVIKLYKDFYCVYRKLLEELLQLKLLDDLVYMKPVSKRASKERADETSNASLSKWLESEILPAWRLGLMTLPRLQLDTADAVARLRSEMEQRTEETKKLFKQSRLFSSKTPSAHPSAASSPSLAKSALSRRLLALSADETASPSPAAANSGPKAPVRKYKKKRLADDKQRPAGQIATSSAFSFKVPSSSTELQATSPCRPVLMPPPQPQLQQVPFSPPANRSALPSAPEPSPVKSVISISSSSSNSSSPLPHRPISANA